MGRWGDGREGEGENISSSQPVITNGHKKVPQINISQQPQMQTAIVSQPAPAAPVTTPAATPDGGKMQTRPDKVVNFQQALGSLEKLLTQFQQNQTENLQVHSTYLTIRWNTRKRFSN